jgi:hypothetical protein
MSTQLSAVSRRLLLNGAIILTLGLVAGLTIPMAANARTVLAAHVIGITCGLAAMAVAFALPHASLTKRLERIIEWTLLPSLYLGFFTQWLGGFFKLSRMFIVTAAGQPEGPAILESIMEYIIKGISPLTLIPFLILTYGFARNSGSPRLAE